MTRLRKTKKLSKTEIFEEVKPETTGHKAGRIISGILGGLLLAAGIAAATVAVTATFDVVVGVLGTVAAFAGITGSSIAAGAAGCAGIGHITTSALLAPKHPEITDEQINQFNIDKCKNSTLIKGFAAKFIRDQATEQSKTISFNPNDQDGLELTYRRFTSEVLENAGLNANTDKIKASKQNIKLVQEALLQYYAQNIETASLDSMVKVMSDPEFLEDMTKYINSSIEKHDNHNDKALLSIFSAAINYDD